MRLRDLRPGARQAAIDELQQRVADLEADLTQLRRHQMRLAEVADVVQELLVPMASRDEEAVRAAIQRFQDTLS